MVVVGTELTELKSVNGGLVSVYVKLWLDSLLQT